MGRDEKKKSKKHKHKHKHKKDKVRLGKHKSKKSNKLPKEDNNVNLESDDQIQDFAIPIALMNSKSHAPERPEEYEKRQSQIRREVDPVTGRTRLIKGDSEILEEIVSKERHTDINRKATRGDGEFFEKQSLAAAAQKKKSKR